MIEILLCQLIDLFAKKKLLLNLFYLVGTTMFLLLSYNTGKEERKGIASIFLPWLRRYLANRLPVVPLLVVRATGENQTSNAIDTILHQRSERSQSQCRYSGTSSRAMLINLFHRSHLLNHLGFVLRSHSFFYCSVPKVATRTFLPFLTYLHVRDELLTNATLTLPRPLSQQVTTSD